MKWANLINYNLSVINRSALDNIPYIFRPPFRLFWCARISRKFSERFFLFFFFWMKRQKPRRSQTWLKFMPKLASVRVKAILIISQFIFNSFGDVYCRHFIDINSERFASTVLEKLSSRWQQSFTLRRLRRAIGDVNSCWICIKGEERKFASWWQRNFFCGSLWWQILLRPELIYDLTMLLP